MGSDVLAAISFIARLQQKWPGKIRHFVEKNDRVPVAELVKPCAGGRPFVSS